MFLVCFFFLLFLLLFPLKALSLLFPFKGAMVMVTSLMLSHKKKHACEIHALIHYMDKVLILRALDFLNMLRTVAAAEVGAAVEALTVRQQQ